MATMVRDIPGTHHAWVSSRSFGTANNNEHAVLWVAPEAVWVTSVTFYPSAQVVGHSTNHFKLTLTAGTVAIGSAAFTSGTVAVGSGTPVYTGRAKVDGGRVLKVQYGTVGTGMDCPAGLWEIRFNYQ